MVSKLKRYYDALYQERVWGPIKEMSRHGQFALLYGDRPGRLKEVLQQERALDIVVKQVVFDE